MTKQECIENHRKMWNWIADETEKQERIVDKGDYFNVMKIPYKSRPLFECYACDFCEADCEKCPIQWEMGKCYHGDSPFVKWGEAVMIARINPLKFYKEVAQYAREIANLPERKGEETEN